jgi:hypothetical protein
MALVAGGVAIQFGQPPFPSIGGRRAVLAAAMPMPETAVNENRGVIFRQNDVGTAGKFSDVQPKAKALAMKL